MSPGAVWKGCAEAGATAEAEKNAAAASRLFRACVMAIPPACTTLNAGSRLHGRPALPSGDTLVGGAVAPYQDRRSYMNKGRLEAFSDGVIAILITIMVLELKVPAWAQLGRRASAAPDLSRLPAELHHLGIYWNNHHHMLHVDRPDQRRHSVGKSAPAVLAVAHSVRHAMGRRVSQRTAADGRLRRRAPGSRRSRTRFSRQSIIADQGPGSPAPRRGRQ